MKVTLELTPQAAQALLATADQQVTEAQQQLQAAIASRNELRLAINPAALVDRSDGGRARKGATMLAVRKWLDAHPGREPVGRDIARHIGANPTTVGNILRRLNGKTK